MSNCLFDINILFFNMYVIFVYMQCKAERKLNGLIVAIIALEIKSVESKNHTDTQTNSHLYTQINYVK